MNSAWTRLNAIFTYSLCLIALLTFFCFLSTAYYNYGAPVNLDAEKVSVSLIPDFTGSGEPADMGFMKLYIKGDFNPIFNWNVKELFIYLTAEYETPQNKINQIILWDKIIERGQNAKLNYEDLKPKYYFVDDGEGGLKGNKNISLSLTWNVIPNTGPMFDIVGRGGNTIHFPDTYVQRGKY